MRRRRDPVRIARPGQVAGSSAGKVGWRKLGRSQWLGRKSEPHPAEETSPRLRRVRPAEARRGSAGRTSAVSPRGEAVAARFARCLLPGRRRVRPAGRARGRLIGDGGRARPEQARTMEVARAGSAIASDAPCAPTRTEWPPGEPDSHPARRRHPPRDSTSALAQGSSLSVIVAIPAGCRVRPPRPSLTTRALLDDRTPSLARLGTRLGFRLLRNGVRARLSADPPMTRS